MTKKDLRELYDSKYAQAGDTEEDFTNWAIDYLLDHRDKQFLKVLKRHTKGIEKAIETLER